MAKGRGAGEFGAVETPGGRWLVGPFSCVGPPWTGLLGFVHSGCKLAQLSARATVHPPSSSLRGMTMDRVRVR
jgi:hypothetical protein